MKTKCELLDLLKRYSVPVPVDIEDHTCAKSPLRFARVLDNGIIYCDGLQDNHNPDTVLITQEHGLDLTREQLETLNDWAVFAAGDSRWYTEKAKEMETELERLGVSVPSEVYQCYGFGYPGRCSFAFELRGKLVFT